MYVFKEFFLASRNDGEAKRVNKSYKAILSYSFSSNWMLSILKKQRLYKVSTKAVLFFEQLPLKSVYIVFMQIVQ